MEGIFDIDFSVVGIITAIAVGFAEAVGSAITEILVGIAQNIADAFGGFGNV